MPHRPTTPTRTVRIDDELWADMLKAVDINRENVSLVIRRTAKEYVEKTKREHPNEWEQA